MNETFHDGAGVTWSTRHERVASTSPQATGSLYRIFRDGKDVAQLYESAMIQSNPTMMRSSSWRFFLTAKNEFRAEVRNSTQNGHEVPAEVTTAVFEWSGTEFVPLAPKP